MAEIARHYTNAGRAEAGIEYDKQALDIYTELGDKAGQARILQGLGSINLSARNIEESIQYYQRSLDLFVEIEDKEGEALSHAGVKLLERFGGQIAETSFEKEQSKIVLYGAMRETFSKSSDALIYAGMAGTVGSFVWISTDDYEPEDFVKPSAFRFCFLPYMVKMIKLLDFPISVGNSWSREVPSGGLEPMKLTTTILSDGETVSVPAGDFSDCLRTQIVTSEEPEDCDQDRCGVRELIYAPGVGLVKSTFVRRSGTTDIVLLANCTVRGDSADHFPLEIGNKWIYEWADEEGKFPSTDVYEVIGADNSNHYISHYHYALKQTDQANEG